MLGLNLEFAADAIHLNLRPKRTLTALDSASAVCLVTDASLPGLKATLDCMEVLDKLRHPVERRVLVLNRRAPLGMAMEQVTHFFGRPPDLQINYSDLFDRAANSGRPVLLADPEGPASVELRALAARLLEVADPGP